MACGASWRHIQATKHRRNGERCEPMGWVCEAIFWQILPEIMHRSPAHIVQWPIMQGYRMEPQKKKETLYWTIWALWPNELCLLLNFETATTINDSVSKFFYHNKNWVALQISNFYTKIESQMTWHSPCKFHVITIFDIIIKIIFI